MRQDPAHLSVMRGETAALYCHFKVESLKYGVQWFKMKSEKQLIQKSPRHSMVEKNQTSCLVITEVAPEDCGLYYCEVNVLQKDPERGNGTKLTVLGEKQIACCRNEHARNSLGSAVLGLTLPRWLITSHLYLLCTKVGPFSARRLDTSAGAAHASP